MTQKRTRDPDRPARISFLDDSLITEVLEVVQSGKEATVFRCRAAAVHPAAILRRQGVSPDESAEFPQRWRLSAGPLAAVLAFARLAGLAGGCLALLPIARAPGFRAELAAGAPAAFAVAGAVYIGVALFLALTVEVLAHSFSRYALRKSPAALQPQVVTLTNDGVRTQGSHRRWNEFSRVVETRSAFQLQLRGGP